MSTIIDISQKIYPDMMVYSGDPLFRSQLVSSFNTGSECEVSEITIGSHCGTHIDAPRHMIPGGAGVDSLPLDAFIGPCRVLTVRQALISEKVLMEAQIQEGERLLLRTDPEGTHMKSGKFNPAVLSVRAANLLVSLGVKLVGIDAPTVENMELYDGEVHRILLGGNVGILEGLCLRNAPDGTYFLSALPLRMVNENGTPCRAVLIKD